MRPFDVFRPFPGVRQREETDCGAACLATVSRSLCLRCPSVAEIRRLAGTDRSGTTIAGLVQAAGPLGLVARGVRAAPAALPRLPAPFIAHLVEGGLHHFVVVLRVGPRRLRLWDPGRGLLQRSVQEFVSAWSGAAVLLSRDETAETVASRSAVRDLVRILEPDDFLLGELFAVLLVLLVLGIAGSLALQFFVDRILPARNLRLLDWLVIGLTGVVVFKASFGYLRGLLQAYLARRIDARLLGGFFAHILRLPMSFYDSRHVGDVLARFSDAVKVRDALAGSAVFLFVDAVTILGGAAVVAFFEIRLAWLALAIVPVALGGMLVLGQRLRSAQRRIVEQGAVVQSQTVETIRAAGAVKSLGRERDVEGHAGEKIARLVSLVFRANVLAAAGLAIGELLTGLVFVAVARQAMLLGIRGSLSAGGVVAVYAILLSMLQPVYRLFGLAPALGDAVVGTERLTEVLELKRESGLDRDAPPTGTRKMDLELQRVSFRYGPRTTVLQEIDLRVPFGTTLAIVGETGSGKSTLARLLLRFYEPAGGAIFLGGRDISSLPLSELRASIGYVDQNPVLLDATVKENLRFFDETISDERIREVVSSMGLERFLDSLPDGYDTRVGENGLMLSGGQRQLVCLARILLRNPPILILDEAFSQLDPATELRLRRVLDRERGRTTIHIVHRLELARTADQILVLDAGRVRELGSHEALVRQGGVYSRLWSGEPISPASLAEPPSIGSARAVSL